jgi:hypothetical protein
MNSGISGISGISGFCLLRGARVLGETENQKYAEFQESAEF